MESSKLETQVKMLEDGLQRVGLAYEQYFSGVSKIPPITQHEDWKKELLHLNPADLTSSSLKFRFVNLKQRATQMENHWRRVCQQIEDGTYRRDLQKHRMMSTAEHKAEVRDLAGLSEKESKALDTLYSKISEAKSKAPDKDKFFEKMKLQVQNFKKKNPGEKMQFKVGKDQKGRLSIKIAKK